MSDKYKNSYDLAAKAEWEGSFSGLVLDYGLKLTDLPDDLPEDVKDAVIRCLDAKDDFDFVNSYLSDALDHCPYPDDEIWDE